MRTLDFEDDLVLEKPPPAFESGLPRAIGWGAVAAVLAGGGWVVGLVVAFRWLKLAPVPDSADLNGRVVEFALLFGGWLALAGAIVGGAVGFARGGRCRGVTSAFLAIGGTLFGGIGGATCVLAAGLLGTPTHPFLTAAVTWAVVGFCTGFAGFWWSSWLTARVQEMEDADPPHKRAKREPRDRTEYGGAVLVRVLPVLAVSFAAVVGAALVAPGEGWAALVAVGALGVSVALVLLRQERRLEALERRQREGK